MRVKLPPYYQAALESRSPLVGIKLHKAVLELIEFYHEEHEMIFPSLNLPLLLRNHLADLALPSK